MPSSALFQEWLRHVRKIGSLDSTGGLLEYDQRVTMPEANTDIRAFDIGVMEEICHAALIEPWFIEATDRLLRSGDIIDPEELACLTVMKRKVDRAASVPTQFAAEIASKSTLSYEAWKEAKPTSNFAAFLPHLKEMVRLKREEAFYIGAGEFQCPYDVLIDDYAPGMTLVRLLPLLENVVDTLKPMVDRARGIEIPTDVLNLPFPEGDTVRFGMKVIEDLGYDFKRGMLVRTPHPVTMGLSVNDVRISVYSEFKGLVLTMLAMIHESGHGMYRQGCPQRWWHTPLGGPMPISINESQSRFYEIILGRDLPFWEHYFPQMIERFPFLKNHDYGPGDIYRAINRIEPGYIRVAADPLTYPAHILLRVRIESALINNEMQAEDVPAAWDEQMEKFLGLKPRNHAEGCMQDVHWSHGMFGYFGSYTLGDLFAAQINETLIAEFPDLHDRIRDGQFALIREWLRQKIHSKGYSRSNEQLIMEVTGKPLDHKSLVRLAQKRVSDVYGV